MSFKMAESYLNPDAQENLSPEEKQKLSQHYISSLLEEAPPFHLYNPDLDGVLFQFLRDKDPQFIFAVESLAGIISLFEENMSMTADALTALSFDRFRAALVLALPIWQEHVAQYLTNIRADSGYDFSGPFSCLGAFWERGESFASCVAEIFPEPNVKRRCHPPMIRMHIQNMMPV